MTEFGSAVASDADILRHLVAYGVQTDDAKAALAADPSSVQWVMETMLANVFRIPSAWLQPYFSYPADLESPEAFDDSVSDWNFYAALKECLSRIGVSGYRWKDLHEPQSKQVRRQMAAIINYARFCEWQEGKAEAIDEEFAAVVEHNDELKQSLDQLRREYEVSCGDHDDKEAQLLEMEQIHADEESKLESLTRDYEAHLVALERAGETSTHSERQLRNMEAKRAATATALEQLRGNLCEDQDELLAELAKEKELTDKYQRESAAAGTQRSYYAKWSCEAKEYQEDVIKTVRMLEETLVLQEAEEVLRRQLADAVEAVQGIEAGKSSALEEQAKRVQELQERTGEYERERARTSGEEASAAAVLDCGEKQREHAAARVEMLQERMTEANMQAAAAAKQLDEIEWSRNERQAQCAVQYRRTAAAVRKLALRTCSRIELALQGYTQGKTGTEEGADGTAATAAVLRVRAAGLRDKAGALDGHWDLEDSP